jgi:hypothetical protein
MNSSAKLTVRIFSCNYRADHEKMHRKAIEEAKATETRLAFLEEQIELRVTKVQLRQDMAAYATKIELQDLA